MGVVADNQIIRIEKLSLGPFGTNSYLLICQETKESVIVDAPGDAGKVMTSLMGTTPKYILMTHDHMDHVGALNQLKSDLDLPVAAHDADSRNLPLKPDLLLEDGDSITFGNITLKAMHTPGHTPGSLCFYTDGYLISGDTLFPGGPGKTGSPAAFKQIVESVTGQIFELPDETEVHPGHGDGTTVEAAKKEYAVFSSKPHDPNLCGDVLWDG